MLRIQLYTSRCMFVVNNDRVSTQNKTCLIVRSEIGFDTERKMENMNSESIYVEDTGVSIDL